MKVVKPPASEIIANVCCDAAPMFLGLSKQLGFLMTFSKSNRIVLADIATSWKQTRKSTRLVLKEQVVVCTWSQITAVGVLAIGEL